MAKVVYFNLPGATGHINPAVGIVSELIRQVCIEEPPVRVAVNRRDVPQDALRVQELGALHLALHLLEAGGLGGGQVAFALARQQFAQ